MEFFRERKGIIITSILVLVLFVGSYFSYDYYITSQYKEQIGLVYRAFIVLDKELMEFENKSQKKRFIDIFDDIKNLKQKSNDLKLKLSETEARNGKSKEIYEEFSYLLNVQCNVFDNYTTLYDSEMRSQGLKEYINVFGGNPYADIQKSKSDLEKANKTLDETYQKRDWLMNSYKNQKEKVRVYLDN